MRLLSFLIQELCQVLVEFVEVNLYQTSGKDGFNVNMLSNQWLVGVFFWTGQQQFLCQINMFVNCLAFVRSGPSLSCTKQRVRTTHRLDILHGLHF